MKRNITKKISILILISVYSCSIPNQPESIDEETWRLGWRMIENSWDENYSLAELQFDSLLEISNRVDKRFLTTGLEMKAKRNKNEEVANILRNQDEETLKMLCKKEFLSNWKLCNRVSEEKVKNESLQLELIEMFVNDQAVRGNIMMDMVKKYDLDSTKIINRGEIIVDEKYLNRLYEIFEGFGFSNKEVEIFRTYINNPEAIGKSMKDFIAKYELDSNKIRGVSSVFIDEKNRDRLKKIFKEDGFPNKELVGKDAMRGIFLMIQHSDGDKDWQKSQLKNIELAVKNGDMNGQSYAYLYDRIKINHGQPQRFGSQVKNVTNNSRIVELKDTEDLVNLNKRRREMGMMPIEVYKRLIWKQYGKN